MSRVRHFDACVSIVLPGGTMQEFDPRRPSFRVTPRVALGVGGLAALFLAWRLMGGEAAPPAPQAKPLDPAEIAALQHEAFAEAEAQPGFTRAEAVPLKIQRGETFEAAIRRAGVDAGEAREAASVLGGAMDIINIKAGMAFDAAVAQPRGERGPARLIGLSLRTGPASAITLSRTFDGALRLREMEEKVTEEMTVADGEIHPGDEFTLVFGRKVTESGRTVATGELEYAEFKGQRFYRFERPSGEVDYFDETGKNIRGFLLRTPIDGARMTSRFGMRRHP